MPGRAPAGHLTATPCAGYHELKAPSIHAALAESDLVQLRSTSNLKERYEFISTYDERFSRVATCLAGLFRMAGHPDLADRVRPSSRRSGQTEDEAPPAPTGGTGSPAGSAPGADR
jgi:hypothetical protein